MEKSKKNALSGVIMLGLVMVSHTSYAGLNNKFEKYMGNDSAYASGFYIILSVIAVGVIGKICQHLFITEEDKPVSKVRVSHHGHHHHRSRIIKKTN